jgi:hypothetical protein
MLHGVAFCCIRAGRRLSAVSAPTTRQPSGIADVPKPQADFVSSQQARVRPRWNSAFRRIWAENRLKAELQLRLTQGYCEVAGCLRTQQGQIIRTHVGTNCVPLVIPFSIPRIA